MKKLVFSLLVCATGLAAQAQVTKLPEGFTSGKTDPNKEQGQIP